uniref:Uncharacterized protein n=1 Tax=viral metagenome TaxID=1070528 RepID=A0A6C0DD44_9ZZZZ
MPKRCPNGTRRNKTTGKCEPTNSMRSKSPKKNNKTAKKTPVKRCNKMPPHRIHDIVERERGIDEAISFKRRPDYYERMKTKLESLCFPKGTEWTKVSGYDIALYKAI